MHRWLLPALLGLALALTGCAAHPPAPGLDWPRSPDHVVFQLDTIRSKIGIIDEKAHVPDLTVYGDGRAIFVQRDGQGDERILQTRLSADQLRSLVTLADRNLSGLKGHYDALDATDGSDTRFSLATAAATRHVSVYCLPLQPTAYEHDKAVMKRLRAVQTAFLSALPQDAGAYVPELVTILALQADPNWPAPPRDWPADLPPLPAPSDQWEVIQTTVTGTLAEQIARQIPHRSHQPYRIADQSYFIGVKPSIPDLWP